MPSSRTVIDASSPKLPTSATAVSVPSAGALTSAAVIDLSGYLSGGGGQFVTFYGTGGVWRPRASTTQVAAQTSAAATAADAPHKEDTQYSFQVTDSTKFVSVYGDAAVTLTYWLSS